MDKREEIQRASTGVQPWQKMTLILSYRVGQRRSVLSVFDVRREYILQLTKRKLGPHGRQEGRIECGWWVVVKGERQRNRKLRPHTASSAFHLESGRYELCAAKMGRRKERWWAVKGVKGKKERIGWRKGLRRSNRSRRNEITISDASNTHAQTDRPTPTFLCHIVSGAPWREVRRLEEGETGRSRHPVDLKVGHWNYDRE